MEPDITLVGLYVLAIFYALASTIHTIIEVKKGNYKNVHRTILSVPILIVLLILPIIKYFMGE